MSSDDSNDLATLLAALKAQMAEDKAAANAESASVRAESIALRSKVEQLMAQLSTLPPTSQVRLNIGSMQSLHSWTSSAPSNSFDHNQSHRAGGNAEKISSPNMRSFDGTSDPDDHMAQFRQSMLTLTVLRESREACMCRAFGCCLTGPALQWFINLPNAFINSFAQLTDLFIKQFTSSRRLHKASDDLYKIKRGPDESLRSYIGRFLVEKVLIPSCNMETVVMTFRKGLSPSDELYTELTKFPCTNMEDLLARAWAQVK
ncbi:uncharacterized protein LOC119987903 [Tripterygium wilfordii]|uniref:uncharacterized protein LOC119987903 n=1 Tax=Tripterygium wilfordii TaxID=458696 RepID=UPI0018F7EFA6|nr:uncharacterized protein LOC119987903 [Tripterygium wilfordii]